MNTIAREIAEDRAARSESKIAFARELVAGAPRPAAVYDMYPERFHEDIFIAQLRKDGGYGRGVPASDASELISAGGALYP